MKIKELIHVLISYSKRFVDGSQGKINLMNKAFALVASINAFNMSIDVSFKVLLFPPCIEH